MTVAAGALLKVATIRVVLPLHDITVGTGLSGKTLDSRRFFAILDPVIISLTVGKANYSLCFDNVFGVLLVHLNAVVNYEILFKEEHQARFDRPIIPRDVGVEIRLQMFVVKEMCEFEKPRIELLPLESVEFDLVMDDEVPVERRPANVQPLLLFDWYAKTLESSQRPFKRNGAFVRFGLIDVLVNENGVDRL